MQLLEFRDQYLELLLQFLWGQWSSLGVAGTAESEDPWIIDPEALLALTGTIGRYDQRLFDEVIDWLDKNERFINVQRLRNILKKEEFVSAPVIGALAGKFYKNKNKLKWKGLALEYPKNNTPEQMFYLKNGKPLPVIGAKDQEFLEFGFIRNPVINRGLSNIFPPKEVSSLLLQLRALFGLNSRSEVMLYMLVNGKGSIKEIADQTYYAWRSVQDVLYEMGHSAILQFPEVKKGRIYYMKNEPWLNMLLKKPNQPIQWICWPPLFRALEIIWMNLNDEILLTSTKLEKSADLQRIMLSSIVPRIIKAGFGSDYEDLEGYWGEEYLDRWLESIKGILG